MVNTFDITGFGAVPDGITDCTAAVQKALDSASTCMGTVIVPPGVYKVGHLKMKGQGVSIVGTAAWTYRSDGASIFSLNDAETDCMIDVSGAFGASIMGMSLAGEKLGENVHGVKLWWPEYNGGAEEDCPTIDNCRIGNFSGDGVHFEHVWCFSVRHSMLHNNVGCGLYIDGWDGFLVDNWFSCNMNGGILGGPIAASVTATGNRVEWNHRGGFVLPCANSFNVTGNFFDRSFGPALQFGGRDGKTASLITVTGNIFRRSGARDNQSDTFEHPDMNSHLAMYNCRDAVVTGNSMATGKHDGGGGALSPDYSFIIDNCTDSIFKDNVMSKAALVENVILRGDDSTLIIGENIGRLDTLN